MIGSVWFAVAAFSPFPRAPIVGRVGDVAASILLR